MRKFIKSTIASLLAVILVITSGTPIFAVDSQTSAYSANANSGTRGEECVSLEGTSALSYYGSTYSYDKLSEMSSDELLTSLRTLMTGTHKKITTYENCRDYAPYTDCQGGDGTSVILLYSSYVDSMSGYSGYNVSYGWNREHVWPQSMGSFGTTKGGADLHHVRPADSSANTSRNNKLYGNVDNPTGITYTSSRTGNIACGLSTSEYFEPNDEVKGDVARICLYVYVRWGATYTTYVDSETGKTVYGCDSLLNCFQSIDVLLEWCALDPVDTWEMGRNEVVQSIQGNRNVFIDYPELAWILLGEEVPEDMTTPSRGEYVVSDCSHANTELRNVVAVSCTQNGYTGDTYCLDCQQTVKRGSEVSSITAHSFGEWATKEDGYTQFKCCSLCGYEYIRSMEEVEATVATDAEKILIYLIIGSTDVALLDEFSKQ